MFNPKRTSKIIQIAYCIMMVIMAGVLIFEACCLKDDVYTARNEQSLSTIENYTTDWVEDVSLLQGGKDVINFTIPDMATIGSDLTFYTIHQSVMVYIEDVLVYSVMPSKDNAFGKTPGNFWNCVSLNRSDIGKKVRIELIPTYSGNIGQIPKLYFGDRWTLYKERLVGNVMITVLAYLSMLLGVVFVLWVFIYRKTDGVDKSILHIGSFSFFMGTWKLTDLDTAMIFSNMPIATAAIPIVSLFLVAIPALFFIRDFFGEKRERYYNVVTGIGVAGLLCVVVLQVLDIWDFRQTLYLAHITFCVMVGSCALDMYREVKRKGWSTSMKIAVFCLVACFVGLVVDMGVYYAYAGSVSTGFGMIGFLSYVVVMGIFRVRESLFLIERGRKAGHYRNMAFHDQMTGAYSRIAYTEYVNNPNFIKVNCAVAMLDLNELKKCNDTYGHEAGDRYIKSSVNIIQSVFGQAGKCFRLGGDEFCVLLQNSDLEACRVYGIKLREAEDKYRYDNPLEFPVNIAYGYALFDDEKDFDISDTVRRADKGMYINKLDIKKEKNK